MEDFDDLATKLHEAWGMRATTLPDSKHDILLLWNKKARLHGVAILGVYHNTDPTIVAVPIERWAQLRTLGDRVVKPTVVFIRAPTKVFYFASWPPSSGIHYDVIETGGGSAGIPKREFAELKKAEKK